LFDNVTNATGLVIPLKIPQTLLISQFIYSYVLMPSISMVSFSLKFELIRSLIKVDGRSK